MTDMTALDALFATMPPVVAMQIRASHFDGARLLLEAPLAANLNDKGCAFGGSLVSVMVDETDAPRAELILNEARGVDALTRGDAYRQEGWTGFEAAKDDNYPETGRVI